MRLRALGVALTARAAVATTPAALTTVNIVGAAFLTDTKAVGRALTRDEIVEVLKAGGIPACAIGGINEVTGPQLEGLGLDGISVISSILSRPDITAAARTMRDVAEKIKG